VSEVAARLAQRGAITYTRGEVTVEDRARLEQASCECYRIIRQMLDRMLGDPAAAALATHGDDDGRGVVPAPR
jgi:Mn-dependent DtxR family transcriptional regulator